MKYSSLFVKTVVVHQQFPLLKSKCFNPYLVWEVCFLNELSHNDWPTVGDLQKLQVRNSYSLAVSLKQLFHAENILLAFYGFNCIVVSNSTKLQIEHSINVKLASKITIIGAMKESLDC